MDAIDPRIERSRRVIGEAALVELAEAGYGGFTIDSVARRAGVGRSTVYRHWGGKLALIADALDRLNEQPGPEQADAPTARARVENLLRHLADALAHPVIGRCLPALVDGAERDGTVREFHHGYSARRRRALTDAISAGVRAGEFRDVDPELASLALAGAVFYRRLMTGTPFGAAEVAGLVDTVLGR